MERGRRMEHSQGLFYVNGEGCITSSTVNNVPIDNLSVIIDVDGVVLKWGSYKEISRIYHSSGYTYFREFVTIGIFSFGGMYLKHGVDFVCTLSSYICNSIGKVAWDILFTWSDEELVALVEDLQNKGW